MYSRRYLQPTQAGCYSASTEAGLEIRLLWLIIPPLALSHTQCANTDIVWDLARVHLLLKARGHDRTVKTRQVRLLARRGRLLERGHCLEVGADVGLGRSRGLLVVRFDLLRKRVLQRHPDLEVVLWLDGLLVLLGHQLPRVLGNWLVVRLR